MRSQVRLSRLKTIIDTRALFYQIRHMAYPDPFTMQIVAAFTAGALFGSMLTTLLFTVVAYGV